MTGRRGPRLACGVPYHKSQALSASALSRLCRDGGRFARGPGRREPVRESIADVTDASKLGSDQRLWLWDRLLQESELMATYALASGLKVPEAAVQALAVAALQGSSAEAKLTAANGRDLSARNREPGMMRHHNTGSESSIRQLTYAHNRLVDIVARRRRAPFCSWKRAPDKQVPGDSWESAVRETDDVHAILYLLGLIVTRAILHLNALPQGENVLPGVWGRCSSNCIS